MLLEIFFFTLFTNDLIIVHSAEHSAPLQFTEEPSDIQFSSQTSGYLHCVAKTTSSYASNNQIVITWRFGNGSVVKNISNIVQALPNGTLWFKPFEKIIPAVHLAKYQCVANLSLHNQAILSRQVLVHSVVVKPFQVKVEDEYVLAGETASFSCRYPQEVSSYVKIRKWFADREFIKEVEPSGNLVIQDVQEADSYKLYYCIVENILTKEIIASNVAKIFIQETSGSFQFKISPVNKTVVNGETVLFECLASRTRNIEYIWKHNDKDIKIDHRYSLVSGRSLRIKDITLDDQGTYSCSARDKTTNEEISSGAYLLVQVPLLFLARPRKICTQYYVNATFPCEVSGYPPPKITWYKNAIKITNNKKVMRMGNSLIITSTWGKDEGIYQCMASNEFEIIHQAASLIVGAQAPIIVKSFKAKNLSLHEKLDISCKATGKQQATLFWYKDGKVIEESFDDRINLKHYHDLWTLQIRNMTAADSGTYRCEAMNRAGSSFSEAKILVKGPAKVTYLFEKVRGLLGKDVTITCKASGFPSVKIKWLDKSGYRAPYNHRQKEDVIKEGETTLTIKELRPTDKGSYICEASSGLGPPDSSSVYLDVYDPPKKEHTLKVVDEGNKLSIVCNDCIKWTRNGNVVNNTDRTTVMIFHDVCFLRINDILRSDAGNYTCHRQTETGGIDQQIEEILVITKPRLIPSHRPNPTNVLEHENVRMSCHGYGFPTPRITWKRKIGGAFAELPDSSRFHVSANGSLTIMNVKAEDETYYSCMAENSHPSKADLTITLHVNVPARIVNWLTSAFGDAGNITKLNCEASGDEILNITWFKNGREITKHLKIQRLSKSSKSSLTILSTTDKDGGDYMCKVFNSFGKDEKMMKLKIRDRPNPPILKTGYKKTKKSITIFWAAPLFDGNSPILSYQIYSRASAYPSKMWNFSVVWGKKTEFSITNLEPYRRYEIRLRAKNSLGPSDFSNVIHAETAEDVPSAAPTFTQVIPIEHSLYEQCLRVKWKRLSVEDSNGVITGYIIWVKKNSSEYSFKKITIERIQGTQATISSLKPYTYYILKIQAKTNAGSGPNSTTVIRRTLEGVPSEPPRNFRVIAKTSTSISLSWKTPSKSSLNGELTGYRVDYQENTTPLKHRFIADTARNQTSLTLNNLGKYTNYTIKIAARTVRGPGKTSFPINDVTDEDIPGPPKDLIAVTTSVRSVKLQWSKPDEPNGRITSYKIYYVKNIENIDIKDTYNILNVERTSHEFENLTENRTYYFWVCAKTSKGEGNCTDDVMASTSKGPPSFINNYSGDVTARWKKSATLICRFSGFPVPTITWLDSKEKPLDFGYNNKYHKTTQGHLVIQNLQREDSKRYVCKVTNKWGTIKKGITLKVQAPPDPPKSIGFIGINSTAVKISWINGFDGNSIITEFILKYQIRADHEWKEERLPGYSSEHVLTVQSGKSYSFMMRASNEIGPGNFSETKFMRFTEGAILKPIEEQELEDEITTKFSHKTIFKDSAVLGTLIGVCLFIVIFILVLVLLAKFGYNPGSKLAQRSVEAWRWLLAKGMPAKAHRKNMNRRSGGSSTDGHLGGSSSSLSQPASNNGSTFSLPRTSSRVTESGCAGSGVPPLPFSNFTPGPNGGVRASGSSDEGIGPETRSEIHGRPDTSDKEYRQPSIPPRSSNGTPAPPTLMMSSREYIDPEGTENEASYLKRERHPLHSKELEDKMADVKENDGEDISPDYPSGKERIYVESLTHCGEFIHVPLRMSPGRPKYEDAHYIIGPDADRILAYRPPRCYDSTSSEYSSSRDELAQAYEFGKLHHLDDFYGRPTLESASSSGETANSEKDGICHFTSELCVGRPFLIPVAILPPPPNQRLRTRDRKRNPQVLPLNTYYEKDETLV